MFWYFYRFFGFRNNRSNRKTTKIINEIFENNFKLVTCEWSELVFESDTKRIELWNNSRFYAWLTNGKVTDLKTNETYKWKNSLPSRLVTFKLYKLLSNINSKFFTKDYMNESREDLAKKVKKCWRGNNE